MDAFSAARFAMPVRGAILGAVGLPMGTLISGALGLMSETPALLAYLSSALIGGVGGYVGGLLRERFRNDL